MNAIVVYGHMILLFYLIYTFFETSFGYYYVEQTRINHYAIASLLSGIIALFLPLKLVSILFIVIAVLYPMYSYRKEKRFLKQLIHWYILLIACSALIGSIRYFGSILPSVMASFHGFIDILWFDCLALMILIYLLKKQEEIGSYSVLCILGILCTICIDFRYFYFIAYKMTQYIVLLPLSLTFCFIMLYRSTYAMEQSKDNVLKLTTKRYAEKENKEKYEQLEKENQRILQQLHDMKKHLQILSEMQNDNEEFTVYKEEILRNAQELLNEKQSGIPMIDRILQTYQPRVQQARIQCNIEVDKIDFSFMNTIDLSALLANLLDNAIESCEKCEERFILLKIKQQRNMVIFKMKNSCLQINEENKELKTTKTDSIYHGYGMRNMTVIAGKYSGSLKYHFDEEHHVFITTISLFIDHS